MDTERTEKRIRDLSGERRTFILPPELKELDDIEIMINAGWHGIIYEHVKRTMVQTVPKAKCKF